MYGLVNKAVEGLVASNFGQDKWLEIKRPEIKWEWRSNVNVLLEIK